MIRYPSVAAHAKRYYRSPSLHAIAANPMGEAENIGSAVGNSFVATELKCVSTSQICLNGMAWRANTG